MSRKEVPRTGLLKAAVARKISNAEGARALQLSVRQFQRLKARFTVEGVRGLLHRLRGRASPRRLCAELRAHVVTLLQTTYGRLNDCHATEKLREVEGLPISRSTVRRLRRSLGLPAKRGRRGRTVRTRRTPAAQMGALVQLDASPFPWLGPGGPALALHGAIDDATGAGLALVLRPAEDLHGYVTLLAQLCTRYGLPLTLYGDRLNVFVRNDRHWTLAEQLRGRQDPTQFGRILADLGIGFIPAGSPQAKGRIERYWDTLQDRLVAELALRGITTVDGAHAFFPTFLADLATRFARPPAEAAPAWRPAPRDLAALLSCRYSRVVARDNTVRLGPRCVQLPRHRSYVGRRVELRECLDGRLLVFTDARCIAAQPAPPAEFVLRPRAKSSAARAPRSPVVLRADPAEPPYPPTGPNPDISSPPRRRSSTPSAAHPWRHSTPYSTRRRGDILTEQLT